MRFPEPLDKLLDARWEVSQQELPSAANRAREIDAEIRGLYEKTIAPFVLDMAAFTVLAAKHGIIHYLGLIRRMVMIVEPIIHQYKGTIVKTEADNLFAWFDDVPDAVRAALAVQQAVNKANLETKEHSDIHLSFGIGYGPCLLLDGDMWGEEFNYASKLGEDTAERGEILLSSTAAERHDPADGSLVERPVNIAGSPYSTWLVDKK